MSWSKNIAISITKKKSSCVFLNGYLQVVDSYVIYKVSSVYSMMKWRQYVGNGLYDSLIVF